MDDGTILQFIIDKQYKINFPICEASSKAPEKSRNQ